MKAAKSKTRNYRKEATKAQGGLFDELLGVRAELAQNTNPQLTQIAQALVVCGLPYRATQERQVVRQSRSANGSTVTVTFHAMGTGIAMPFGSDRTLLYWLIDQAIKRQSPFVPWSSAKQFMRDMDYSDGGANYAKVRDAYRRISSVAITVERQTESAEELSIMPIIHAARLPKSVNPKALAAAPQGAESEATLGVQFSDSFYREIVSRHVPFPWHLLKALDRKPQMQDYIMFLYWRTFAARTESFISWEQLRAQLWHDDSNPWRIRQRFAEAIQTLKIAWPHLRAEVRPGGLWIVPAAEGKGLIATDKRLLDKP